MSLTHILILASAVFLAVLNTTFTIYGATKNAKLETLATDQLRKELPRIINNAENIGLKDGKSKLDYATRWGLVVLRDYLHKPMDKIAAEYTALVQDMIEELLTIPQKKER